MKLSVVVPFIDQWDFTEKCLRSIVSNKKHWTDTEVIALDNGSDSQYDEELQELGVDRIVRNADNVGVLETFRQGLKEAKGDIVAFFHSDVLIHEPGFDDRIIKAFEDDPKLGLAGLLGGRGVYPDGGREGVMSHILGKEWGKTPTQPAALHHGELMTDVARAVVLDGVGMFFRREALEEVAVKTNIFADDRPPHHWYDRNICLNFIREDWHISVIGIQFDHWSGATANTSEKYRDTARKWLKEHGVEPVDDNLDHAIYKVGEEQFLKEWAPYLPLTVDPLSKVLNWRVRPPWVK